MSERITGWKKESSSELKNILALNFCFNVDTSRLLSSDVLEELAINLKSHGHSCSFYGVGNLGFRMTDPFSPIASDGKPEGQHNDPANDHDIVAVTTADFDLFKQNTNLSVESTKEKYGTPNTDTYFHWARLSSPEWKGSNFNIPQYCSVGYTRNRSEKQSLMEIHWLKNESGWHKELLSKYAPWYSTKIGFPIVNVSKGLRTGIWQPYSKEINKRKKHEVRISIPEKFGDDNRDALQAVRVVFGSIQASISAKGFAHITQETRLILRKGVEKASTDLTPIQRENALSRVKTTIHRAESLEHEMGYYCRIEDCKNPFEKHGKVRDIIINTLDDINWGVNVLGKPLREVIT